MKTRRGMTLVEMSVGIAVLSVITLVTAALFKAAIKSYNYTINQVNVLSNARKALEGEGAEHGMAWESMGASSVAGLDAGTLALNGPSGPTTTFALSGTTLRRTRLLDARDQAAGVASLQIAYYSLDAAGGVVESTSAADAAFVTQTLSMRGLGGKTYLFFSGESLRNR
jgi:prepilin-type N-terminal cleavage/methylation domain-containing protein